MRSTLSCAAVPVRYTDVDYDVYLDGSRAMLSGGSPYDRHTYRYSPAFALLVAPAVLWHASLGKLLFCAMDCAVGCLMHRICKALRMSDAQATARSAIWLLNPVVVNVSTRGNADASVVLLVTATIAAALSARRRLWLVGTLCVERSPRGLVRARARAARSLPAAALRSLGVAVHVKLYPVVYGVPLLWHALSRDDRAVAASATRAERPRPVAAVAAARSTPGMLGVGPGCADRTR